MSFQRGIGSLGGTVVLQVGFCTSANYDVFVISIVELLTFAAKINKNVTIRATRNYSRQQFRLGQPYQRNY